jgi:hypothetical protein
MGGESKPKKLNEEFLKMAPPTLFFFVVLHIVAIVRSLMSHGSGLRLPARGRLRWRR